MKFRNKQTPHEIVDAIQFIGVKNLPKVLDFILDGHSDFSHLAVNLAFGKRGIAFKSKTIQLEIPTSEGVVIADRLDMIMKTSSGEFLPMKPGEFIDQFEDMPVIETTAVAA